MSSVNAPWEAALQVGMRALQAPVAALYLRGTQSSVETLQVVCGAPRDAFVPLYAGFDDIAGAAGPTGVAVEHALFCTLSKEVGSGLLVPVWDDTGARLGTLLFGRTHTTPADQTETQVASVCAQHLAVLIAHHTLQYRSQAASEEVLRFQKSLLESQTEASVDGILVVSNAGEILLYNSRFVRLWELSAESIASRSDERLLQDVHEKIVDPDEFRARVEYLYEHPDEVSHEEVVLKDGRFFERYSAPVKSNVGAHYGRVWFFRDVSARRRAEAEVEAARNLAESQRTRLAELAVDLSHQQSWLEALLDRLPVPVLLIAPDALQIYFANKAADRMAGGQFPKVCLTEAANLSATFKEPVEQAAAGQRLAGLQVEWKLPTGKKTLLLHSELLPAVYGHEATVVLAFDEISELKRVHAELQQSVRVRDEFLSIASHELKTPVTALHLQIQSVLRAAAREGDSLLAPWVLHKVDRADGQVERLIRLIDNLLDVSRITAGRLEFEPESLDVAEVVREAAERLREEAARARCALVLHTDAPIEGICDRLRLEQVVTNLLTNAIKYGAGQPIEVRVTPTEDDRIFLQVVDGGIGISKENQSRIFDRFERAVSDRQYGGLGLGLWITRQIVEALGGCIRVDSTPDEGSCFTVELPRMAVGDNAPQS